MIKITALILMLQLAPALALCADTIPPGATTYLPVLAKAYSEQWSAAPLKHISAGQVEQESSWNAKATLKTSRELGRGLVQMTITKSFNIYQDAVKWKALKGWNWRDDPYNAHNQLVFLVLQDKSNFSQVQGWFKDDAERWKGTLVSYNAGEGRVIKRRQYAIAKGLPHDTWTGGLENAHGPLENSVLYGRPLWKAVNEYPTVIFKRAEKYQGKI